MDHYCAEYRGKNLRYCLIGGEFRINTIDLSSVLGVDPQGTDTLDLATAVMLVEAQDPDFAVWLRETFSPTWLHDQMRSYLKSG